VRCRIQDEGKSHRFDIRGTYLVSDLPIQTLSPQNLSKDMTKVEKEPDVTVYHTYSDRVILSWQHGQYKRTVRLVKNQRSSSKVDSSLQKLFKTPETQQKNPK
jgi:hypothetical protein